jgi:Lysozyme inhibitor LprI
MNRHILALSVVVALPLSTIHGQEEAAFRERRLVTAPSGKFHLDWIAEAELAVVKSEPASPEPMPLPAPRETPEDEVAPDSPRAFVSPDDRWVFIAWSGAGYWPVGIAELYRIADEGSVRPEFATRERFDRLAWRFLAEQEKIAENTIAQPRSANEAGRVLAFAAWSADSARLLLSLSAPFAKQKSDSVIREQGIGSWLCYFNVRSGEFELTDRLRDFNRDARKRWRSQFAQVGRESCPLAAEALGHEGAWPLPKERLERADRRLNELYAALLRKLPSAAQKQLRLEEREWLIQRDTETVIYAHQSWSPAPEAALLEGKAIATEARVAVLEKLEHESPR